jgi:PBSX family phage terminase large subunit
MISLKEKIAPPFYKVHNAIERGERSQIWLKGGRGSTKSSFTAIEIVLGVVRDPNANALCLRKVSDTLRTSIHENISWAISELELEEFFESKVSPPEFVYKPTGQKIILKGLDNPQKLKSIKVKRGYFKYLWFEELDEFGGLEEIRNVQQSVLRAGDEFIEFLTYNPPNDVNSWVNEEAKAENSDRYVHHSTYLDVPQHWLGGRFIRDAERLKKNDYDAYRHEYLGDIVGRADQIVFSGKWEERDFEVDNAWGDPLFGADWGFSQDPTALNKMYIYDDVLYITHEAHAIGCDTVDTPELFDTVPDSRRHLIYADNARPETISHMNRFGFQVTGASKWKGSVEDGVAFMRSFKKIVIHSRCVHTIEEFKKYAYKVHRLTKEILPDILDENNHHIDAIRYGLSTLIQNKDEGFIAL